MAALFSHSSGLEILAVLSRDFSEGMVSHVASEDCRTVIIPAFPLARGCRAAEDSSEEPLASALPTEKTCKWVIMCGKRPPKRAQRRASACKSRFSVPALSVLTAYLFPSQGKKKTSALSAEEFC